MKWIKRVAAILGGLAVALWAWGAGAEARFNALDPGDRHYAEYQRNLCAATAADLAKLKADKYWLDHLDPKLRYKGPKAREAWVEDYVVTTALLASQTQTYVKNCPARVNEAVPPAY